MPNGHVWLRYVSRIHGESTHQDVIGVSEHEYELHFVFTILAQSLSKTSTSAQYIPLSVSQNVTFRVERKFKVCTVWDSRFGIGNIAVIAMSRRTCVTFAFDVKTANA